MFLVGFALVVFIINSTFLLFQRYSNYLVNSWIEKELELFTSRKMKRGVESLKQADSEMCSLAISLMFS